MEHPLTDGDSPLPPFDYEGFAYDGFPSGDSCGEETDLPPDDFSRESEGICRVNHHEYSYNYDVINRLLEENRDLKELTGLEEVSTCADAHFFVAAKNYLGSLETFDVPDPAIEPVEDPLWNLNAELVSGKRDVVPLIWHGFEHPTNPTGKEVVQFRLSTGGFCTGVVLNQEYMLTNAHCVTSVAPPGVLGSFCSNCFQAWWINSSTGEKECVTDSTPGSRVCHEEKHTYVTKHPDYSGSQDWDNDIAIVWFWDGWNRSIPAARLYADTPPLWNHLGIGWGRSEMCDSDPLEKRWGNFTVTGVSAKRVTTIAVSDAWWRWCKGDSGGALTYLAGETYRLIFALQAGAIFDYNCSGATQTNCAGTNKNQYAVRVDMKIAWIRSMTSSACPRYTYNGLRYYRCTS